MNQITSKIEQWADIPGYEGLYQVSTLGRVKSLEKLTPTPSGKGRHWPEKILKQLKFKGREYCHVSLYKNQKQKMKSTHRIVAEVFIPNPNNKKEVNHIDGNPSNNDVNNLEWVTRSENALHAYRIGLQKPNFEKSLRISANRRKRKVVKLDSNGNIIEKFNSIIEAKESIEMGKGNISAVLAGRRKKAGGYKWAYINQGDERWTN